MRVEPYTIGDFLHVFNRANQGMVLFPNVSDKWHFLKILRFFNDEYIPINPSRQLDYLLKSGRISRQFEWPKDWPPHRPLVKILSYRLRKTHFHLLLKEIVKGGMSKFMKRLGDAITKYINQKYNRRGRIFQGAYRAKTIGKDVRILQYIDAYVQVFNAFEDYPGGIESALKEFDKAFEFALEDPFSSLGESFGKRNLGIVDRDVLAEMFPNLEIYKKFVYDALLVRNIREVLGRLTIEEC
jgi:hypothetical protein